MRLNAEKYLFELKYVQVAAFTRQRKQLYCYAFTTPILYARPIVIEHDPSITPMTRSLLVTAVASYVAQSDGEVF